jgi:hypothetical protein
MPTDFYLNHPENQGKFVRSLDINNPGHGLHAPDLIEGGNANLVSPNQGRQTTVDRDGRRYMKTPFGPLRTYSEGGKEGGNGEAGYKQHLETMQRFLQRGDMESAKKVYERLPRIDRGIVLSDDHRLANTTSLLKKTAHKVAFTGITGAESTKDFGEATEMLKNAQQEYRSLPAHLQTRVAAGEAKSPLEHLKDIEHYHATLRKKAIDDQGLAQRGYTAPARIAKRMTSADPFAPMPGDADNDRVGRDEQHLIAGHYMFMPHESLRVRD